ncbi:Metallo-beta-lactamase domain-containing [Argiope bruennichi]|uniref:Metallo-beta-lactamase domain-containing n=1 Tax=Argiope bruennichi TaxID=94029 RepID=A0A8T0DZ10_ARGBR|nr:Metallo-beta-lactamase domain-containing [Argiope bruennichi]
MLELHIVGQSISHKDEYLLHSFEDSPFNVTENIKIIGTPGHTLSDVSVIAKNTDLGTVAIVGDLFEREEDILNPTLWKTTAGSENPNLQYQNRKRILNLANYIVPGHGPMFKVTEELKSAHEKQIENITE